MWQPEIWCSFLSSVFEQIETSLGNPTKLTCRTPNPRRDIQSRSVPPGPPAPQTYRNRQSHTTWPAAVRVAAVPLIRGHLPGPWQWTPSSLPRADSLQVPAASRREAVLEQVVMVGGRGLDEAVEGVLKQWQAENLHSYLTNCSW